MLTGKQLQKAHGAHRQQGDDCFIFLLTGGLMMFARVLCDTTRNYRWGIALFN